MNDIFRPKELGATVAFSAPLKIIHDAASSPFVHVALWNGDVSDLTCGRVM